MRLPRFAGVCIHSSHNTGQQLESAAHEGMVRCRDIMNRLTKQVKSHSPEDSPVHSKDFVAMLDETPAEVCQAKNGPLQHNFVWTGTACMPLHSHLHA